ncbi:polyketide synthase [Apiospora rasikravindrae]|uniref:Polyketide synthase n=1 Tax=Apiospora rasikravindrae TaxID=990691 RepID=A0ABR1SDI0_9PEZI
MANVRSSSSSSRSSYEEIPSPDTVPSDSVSSVGSDDEYPALSFPGYAEKPLDEQLEPIAVVGMGCRLPGDVKSTADFWDLMMSKGTGQTPKVPSSRFNIDAHFHKNNDRPGSFGVMGGYFLNEDLADFDPGLFGMTPVEAMWMDPQQRKLLEVVYEALESGGIPLSKINGTRTAVFAASFTADWQQMAFKEHSFRHSLAATGVDPGIISNRISHVFNLKGPSIMCNTACSSSVYALHNACNALRNGEAEGAIVGGVNLIITVDQHMNTAKLGVLSDTSTCHTFDASADGYGRADAVGAVYLKRMSDAVRDGDPIRGVIRTSATNSNGKVHAAGITHPNREGQAHVISAAYKRGGDLDPRLTGYFECHGTGTPVGDPLEVHAVSMAMNKNRPKEGDALWIGAVKTNIGHSEAASGISALIKAIMIVERGIIPPTRGVVNPSPAIHWDDWQVKVPNEAVPFPRLPVRRVSINSFGYGGTNAHVVVEGTESMTKHAPAYTYTNSWTSQRKFTGRRRALERQRPFLLAFSAHDKPTLRRNIDAHGVIAHKYNLADLSYTLGTRRTVLQSKGFAVASYDTLAKTFDEISENFSFADKKQTRSIGFVFTGQGAQWARMGADLMAFSSTFLRSIRSLDLVLEELHDGPDWSIEDALLEHAETSPINQAEFSQPLCTAVQIAIVQLLQFWGIRPTVTVGHSSGEMAAAYAAGLLSAEDAIIAAYYRGLVAKDVSTNGAMLAVGLGGAAVEPYLADGQGKVVVACYNSPALITLSGDADSLTSVKAKLDADGVFARSVKTNGKAYHSHHMVPVSAKYEGLFRDAKASYKATVPLTTTARMVSSVTNTLLPMDTVLDETYWSANLRSPVLFDQAVQQVLTTDQFSEVDLFIEIGPHSALAGPIKQIKAQLKADKIEYLPTLLRGDVCASRMLKAAGELFLRGFAIDMEKVAGAYVNDITATGKPSKGSTIVDLPPYQWNYTRPLWAESRSSQEQRLPKFPRHDLLGQLVIGGSLAEPTWRNVLRVRDLPWLKDHHLGGESVFPAAGYFAMAIEAVRQVNELSSSPVSIQSYVLRDVSIKTALVTPDDDDGIEALFNLRPSVHGSGWWDWSVSSIDGERTKKDHMSGSISINTRPRGKSPRETPQLPQRASGRSWNQALREVGFDYGPTFQDMDDIRFDGKRYQAASSTNIKQVVDESLGESRYVLHPASIDSTLQLCIAAIYAGRSNAMTFGVVPVQVDEVIIWPPTEKQLEARKANAYAVVHRRGLRTSESNVQMMANDGELIMDIVNLRAVAYEAAAPQIAESALKDAPYGEMRWGLDVDVPETRVGLNASELVNLALFKHSGLKTVELGAKHAVSILRKNPRASYTVVVDTDEDEKEVKMEIGEFHNANVIKLDAAIEGLKKEAYDILITSGEEEPSSEIKGLLKPNATPIGSGVLMAKAGHDATPSSERYSVQLIYRNYEAPIIPKLRTALGAMAWDVNVSSLDASSHADVAKHVIMVADFEGPLLYSLQESEFSAVQNIIAKTESLLWVSTGAILDGKKPEYSMVSGLARVVTSEQASIDFRTLDIDIETVDEERIVSSIANLSKVQVTKSDHSLPEREFCVSNGKTYISRLVRNDGLNHLYTPDTEHNSEAFVSSDRIIGKVTKGEVVFQREQYVETIVAPGYVEVQLESTGLTNEGVLAITGSDYATTFSHEIGGVVKRVGTGVSNLEVGDRVVGISAGYFNSFQQIPATLVHKLEGQDDMKTTVSTLMSYCAALYGLETLASVKEGENVLVLNKTGFAGAAAIRVAQLHGAIPYAIARTEDEATFLQSQLGLPVSQVIMPSHGLVSEHLERLTAGHGADVVFSASSVDTEDAHEAWRCIARFGRFLDSGRKHNLRCSVIDGIPTQRGASYLPFDILDVYEHRPEIVSKILPAIVDYTRQGSSSCPGTLQSVELGNLNKAVSAFSDSFGAPKVVLEYSVSHVPLQVLSTREKLRFASDATYLLVGCLGGLGRSLAVWMMERGARRFTFLSRSGVDGQSASKLVADLEEAGALVQVCRGDVTSRDDVERAVSSVPLEYPIKGVIHAAMVLKDGLFHSMSFEAWKQSTHPKVVGAYNLHSVLADTPLDFFLMTSSVSGILGTPGQSNYAAANAYLDSLARYRKAHSRAATSLVLPMVLGVGVVAENTELEDALKRKGMYGIDEEHLLQSFEAGILSTRLEIIPDHVVVGLDPAQLQKAVNAAEATDSFWLDDVRFDHVVHDINTSADGTGAGEAGGQSILVAIKSATSRAEAISVINRHFVEKLARMLMLSLDDVDPEVGSIASYGIDSMIGAELRNWIFKEYRMDVPFQQLLGPTLTICKFAAQVCAFHIPAECVE